MAEETAPAEAAGSEEKAWHKLEVIVRPMPKIIFFYPLWIVSLICIFLPESMAELAGQLWMGVFALNLLVISADFNELAKKVADAKADAVLRAHAGPEPAPLRFELLTKESL